MIVTCTARGIGEGIALKMAEHGAHVAFTYVSESSAEKVALLEERSKSFVVKAKAYRNDAGIIREVQCEDVLNFLRLIVDNRYAKKD